jgi:membrane fusion protein (multidrug efflux system)
MKRMVIMLLAVGVLFGGIFGFKAFVGGKIDEFFDNMPEPVATITATEVREDAWVERLEAVGSFSAVQGTTLTTEVGGIVHEIRFDSGSRVEAGEELLVLDSETDQARLRSLEAAERLARIELERTRRLVSQRNLPEADLPRRQSEADQAAAAVAEQRARIRQKTLRAPFSGELGIREVSLGEYLAPGQAVVSLQTTDPIHIDFTLSERHVARIANGQAINVRADSEGRDFTGRIRAIAPAVQESTRSFAVQAEIANPDGSLKPGMFGRVGIETGEPRTIRVVPQSAIRFNPYGNIVFVLADDDNGDLRVSQRFVQTGARRGDLVEVVQGLEPGERIATSGLLKLRNQARVKVNDEPSLQPPADADPRPDNT